MFSNKIMLGTLMKPNFISGIKEINKEIIQCKLSGRRNEIIGLDNAPQSHIR